LYLEKSIVLKPIVLPQPTVDRTDDRNLYEEDFYQWTQRMVEALRSRNFEQLDVENLLDEVESLGVSQRHALESRLTVLLIHLLKWQFQPGMRSGSWRGTLVEQRTRIRKLLKASPSLRSFLEASIDECYQDARLQAEAETGLGMATFPDVCDYAIEDMLSVEFLPD
jgi:Domain of unknown function DUF29